MGFLSSRDMRLHFGLGNATSIDGIEVTWPSGEVQLLTNVAADQILEVVEPRMELVGMPDLGAACQLRLDSPNDAGLTALFFLSATSIHRTSLPDGRVLPLGFDALSAYTLVPGNMLLANPLSTIAPYGSAAAALTIPNFAFLQGLRLFGTALTLGPSGYPAVRNIFPEPVEVLIQ